MYSLGIDIAGRKGRNFDLALINWGPAPHATPIIHWAVLPLPANENAGYPNFNFPEILHAQEVGNINLIAQLSFPICDFVQLNLQEAVNALCNAAAIQIDQILAVGIDSPSGFSRNTVGHGRATEKVARHFGIGQNGHYKIVPQFTPSMECGIEFESPWGWILFGMAAFYAFESNFQGNQAGWTAFLENGLGAALPALPAHIIEVFPRATIQYLRHQNAQPPQGQQIPAFQAAVINPLINNNPGAGLELGLINAVLGNGRPTKNDRADALLAALTTLPTIVPNQYDYIQLQNPAPTNYAPLPPQWQQEGIITVFGVQ